MFAESVGVVMVTVPETTVHTPAPTVAVFAANVAVVVLQSVLSFPAAAVLGGKLKFTTTSSVEAAHAPFEIVQRKEYEFPATIPVTEVVAEVVLVIVAAPETRLHTPVPTVGVLAEIVVEVTPQIFCVALTLAVLGGSAMLMITSSNVLQVNCVIVQRNVTVLPATSPVTFEVGEADVVTTAVPEITDQAPTPTVAVLAASVKVVVLQMVEGMVS